MTKNQQPDLEWQGPVPVARRFDDPYFSLANGLAETRHVFLTGNDLPARFCDGFHVAELGFGTGLNLFATLAAWREAGREGVLRFTSFEMFPMALTDMARALQAYPELQALAGPVLESLSDGLTGARLPDLHFDLVKGDARETLAHWSGQANAWFLDGFSPAKNPELWENRLMREVAMHTAPQGTFATYTAAGAVRRALEAAGFEVERAPGFGRKRHMTQGILR